MAVTPTTMKARFPEFASIDDSRIQLFIDDAETEMSAGVWGDLYDRGLSYLVAHLLAIGERTALSDTGSSGSVSPVTRKKVGDVEVEYAGIALTELPENALLQSTSYGQEHQRLKMLVVPSMVVV